MYSMEINVTSNSSLSSTGMKKNHRASHKERRKEELEKETITYDERVINSLIIFMIIK